MSDAILTRCPACHTAFRVKEHILGRANGRVRCGACLHVFDARANELASSKAAAAATKTATPAASPTTVQADPQLAAHELAPSPPEAPANDPQLADEEQTPSFDFIFGLDEPEPEPEPKPSQASEPAFELAPDPSAEPQAEPEFTNEPEWEPTAEPENEPESEPWPTPEPTAEPTAAVEAETEFETETLPSANTDDDFWQQQFASTAPTSPDLIEPEPVDDQDPDHDFLFAEFEHTPADTASADDELAIEASDDPQDSSLALFSEPSQADSELDDLGGFHDAMLDLDPSSEQSPGFAPELEADTALTAAAEKPSKSTQPTQATATTEAKTLSLETANHAPSNQASKPAPRRLQNLESEIVLPNYRAAELLDELTPPSKTPPIWTALALASLVLFLGQLGWYQRQSLHQHPALGWLYQPLCQQLDCQLTPKLDLSLIQSQRVDIRQNSEQPGLVLVSAMLINQASFEQDYPDLLLRFHDSSGRLVNLHRLSPPEYLGHQDTRKMPAQQPVQVQFQVENPGPGVGWQLSFTEPLGK